MRQGLKLLMPPEEIEAAVKRLSERIRADYKGKTPVLVGVLKGASVFLSDLIRKMAPSPLEIDFIQTVCYRGDVPGAEVCVVRDVAGKLSGRDVIIVEGVVDRGVTMSAVKENLERKGARSVKVCSLLVREGQRKVKVDYAGRKIEKGVFVVGYGLDYMERFRGLPAIYAMEGVSKKARGRR